MNCTSRSWIPEPVCNCNLAERWLFYERCVRRFKINLFVINQLMRCVWHSKNCENKIGIHRLFLVFLSKETQQWTNMKVNSALNQIWNRVFIHVPRWWLAAQRQIQHLFCYSARHSCWWNKKAISRYFKESDILNYSKYLTATCINNESDILNYSNYLIATCIKK